MKAPSVFGCLGAGWLSAGVMLAAAPHAGTFAFTLVVLGASCLGASLGDRL